MLLLHRQGDFQLGKQVGGVRSRKSTTRLLPPPATPALCENCSLFFRRLGRIADAQGGTHPIELADTDGEGKPLGKLLLNLVAWRVRSLSARLFQKLAHFASHFPWMSMPAFLQRLLPALAHPLAQPVGCLLVSPE